MKQNIMGNLYNSASLLILSTITHIVGSNTLQHQTDKNDGKLEFPLTTLPDYDYIPDPIPPQFANVTAYDCVEKLCVIKCCPKGQFYLISGLDFPKCANISSSNTSDWSPQMKRTMDNLVLIYGLPTKILSQETNNSTTKTECSSYDEGEFFLKDDGRVFLSSSREIIQYDSYCIDNIQEDGKLGVTGIICHKKKEESQFAIITDKLHFAAISVSTFFLFLILLFFAFTPQYLDIQKKCTLSSCLNLFLGFIILLVNNSPAIVKISHKSCLTLGLLTQFFFLAFYFWLNITCYEISRIIRGTFNLQSIRDLTHSTNRYIFYCVYCWGCPLLICSVTLTMQFIPLRSFPVSIRPYIIKPRINEGRCWLLDGASEYAYYYVFEISLHLINAIFMGHTAYLLHREKLIFFWCRRPHSTTTLRIHTSTNYLNAFKGQLRIYIMYLSIWIMNLITLINKHAPIWKIVDIIVAFQGLFLFLFIIQTSKNFLVIPFYERLSNTAKILSNRIGELTGSHCSSNESSTFYIKNKNNNNLSNESS